MLWSFSPVTFAVSVGGGDAGNSLRAPKRSANPPRDGLDI
jgi:hypothetical protein